MYWYSKRLVPPAMRAHEHIASLQIKQIPSAYRGSALGIVRRTFRGKEVKSRRLHRRGGRSGACMPYASGSLHSTRTRRGGHPPKLMKAGVTTQRMSRRAAIMRVDGRHQPRSTPCLPAAGSGSRRAWASTSSPTPTAPGSRSSRPPGPSTPAAPRAARRRRRAAER